MLTAILLGFALGIRHATDPDHVAAIAALVARHRSPWVAARLGAAWGLGHSLMVVAVGGVLVALRIAALPDWAVLAELIVAVVLVALGVANLRDLRRERRHGAHAHVGEATARARSGAWRALGVGVVHGLVGSAAVALLALAAMPSAAAAFVYLAIFAVGTIAGMVAISLGLGLPAALASGRPGLSSWVLGGSGAVSIGVGLYLAVHVGVVTHVL